MRNIFGKEPIIKLIYDSTGEPIEMNFEGAYATDGRSIFNVNQFYVYIDGLGVLRMIGRDVTGDVQYSLLPCKNSNAQFILENATFVDSYYLNHFRYIAWRKIVDTLKAQGYNVSKSSIKFYYKDRLLKKLHPFKFRYLTKAEGYAAMKRLGI